MEMLGCVGQERSLGAKVKEEGIPSANRLKEPHGEGARTKRLFMWDQNAKESTPESKQQPMERDIDFKGPAGEREKGRGKLEGDPTSNFKRV